MKFNPFVLTKTNFHNYALLVTTALFLTAVKTVEICIWVGGSIYFWREVLMPALSEGRTFWVVLPVLVFLGSLFQLAKKKGKNINHSLSWLSDINQANSRYTKDL